MRLFVGIPLAEAVQEEVAKATARPRQREDGLRWTASESWHITLQFLGETGADASKCVAAQLGEVRAAAVPVRLGQFGIFERAGAFVILVEVSRELAALVERVTAATG